jgi:putative ABC transport system permease protein
MCIRDRCGIVLTYPLADRFGKATGTLFPEFRVHDETVWLQLACAALIAVVAALLPCWRATRVRIVDGLRNIG